jgi:hypothetical protein
MTMLFLYATKMLGSIFLYSMSVVLINDVLIGILGGLISCIFYNINF